MDTLVVQIDQFVLDIYIYISITCLLGSYFICDHIMRPYQESSSCWPSNILLLLPSLPRHSQPWALLVSCTKIEKEKTKTKTNINSEISNFRSSFYTSHPQKMGKNKKPRVSNHNHHDGPKQRGSGSSGGQGKNEKRKMASFSKLNTSISKQKGKTGRKKLKQQQQRQKQQNAAIVPFEPRDRILLVGEG